MMPDIESRLPSDKSAGVRVTSQHVTGFAAHMLSHFGARQVDKGDAFFMRAVGGFLNVFRILDKDDFLERFTTTIGRRMWTPFVLGVDDGGGLWSQIETITHEMQHVVQDVEGDDEDTVLDRNAFKLKYATKPAFRLAAEIEAYSANIQLRYWRTSRTPDPDALASLLSSYGLNRERQLAAAQAYRGHVEATRRGVVLTPSAREALAWLQEHAPELRHPGVRPFEVTL